MTLRCLIVDDEPLAHRVVKKYAQDVPGMDIVGACANAFEAMQALQEHEVDLLFLDIDMPRLSGMAFLRTLRRPPLVIITTAHQEYALEGYEMDVVDFLKKPFSFERFLQSVQKAQDRRRRVRPVRPAQADVPPPDEGFLFVKVEKRTVRLNLKDIHYVESLGDYVRFYTADGSLVTYQTLKHMESLLPAEHFPRIHKSYIVALSQVRAIEGNAVEVADAQLPIGKMYRASFMKLIQSFSA